MPKQSKHPKFRRHVKKGKGGQVWVSYWYDNRSTGEPDISLGTDYDQALAKWDEIHNGKKRIKGTIEEAFRRWEEDCLPAYDSEETRKGYSKDLRAIRNVFGPLRWEQIGMLQLSNYLRNRVDPKTKKGGVRANRELSLLSIVWHKGLLWEMTDRPWPAAGLRHSKWKNKEGKRRVKVSNTVWDAIYKHADQILRDCMDLGSATGLRITDCRLIPLAAEDDMLEMVSSKRGKEIEFDVLASKVLPAIIARRKAMEHVCHPYLLTAPNGRAVSYGMLRDRWEAARETAAEEAETAGNKALAEKIRKQWLRDTRKYAAQLAPSLAEAQKLLQHDDPRLTREHYRVGEKVAPVR